MPKRVTRRPLLDLRRIGGLLDGPLHRRVGSVVAPDGPAARVLGERRGGKDVLPPPLGRGTGVLFRNGVGEVNASHPFNAVLFVLSLHLPQVALERGVEALREDRRPVRAALPVPHVDAPVIEVEFLDPETQSLREAKATAVQEMRDQAIRAGREGGKEPLHLVARKHRGEAFGPVGAVDGPDLAELHTEDLFVEEEERIEGLVLRGGRHVAVRGEVIQKGSDVVLLEVAGMGGVVKAYKASHPSHVRLFCVGTVLAALTDLPHLIKKRGGLVSGPGHGERDGIPTGCVV